MHFFTIQQEPVLVSITIYLSIITICFEYLHTRMQSVTEVWECFMLYAWIYIFKLAFKIGIIEGNWWILTFAIKTYKFKYFLQYSIWYRPTLERREDFLVWQTYWGSICCNAHLMQHLQALGMEVLTQDLVICLSLVNGLNTDVM